MTIERNRWGFDGEITFECDECGEELHTETANLDEALKLMRENMWRAIKAGDGWSHYCPACRDKDHA